MIEVTSCLPYLIGLCQANTMPEHEWLAAHPRALAENRSPGTQTRVEVFYWPSKRSRTLLAFSSLAVLIAPLARAGKS